MSRHGKRRKPRGTRAAEPNRFLPPEPEEAPDYWSDQPDRDDYRDSHPNPPESDRPGYPPRAAPRPDPRWQRHPYDDADPGARGDDGWPDGWDDEPPVRPSNRPYPPRAQPRMGRDDRWFGDEPPTPPTPPPAPPPMRPPTPPPPAPPPNPPPPTRPRVGRDDWYRDEPPAPRHSPPLRDYDDLWREDEPRRADQDGRGDENQDEWADQEEWAEDGGGPDDEPRGHRRGGRRSGRATRRGSRRGGSRPVPEPSASASASDSASDPISAGAAARRPTPEPLETNDVLVIVVGTAVWAVAFAALLPFRERLTADGRDWVLWTCLAGFGLGLLGVWYVRRRRAAIAAHRTDQRHAGGATEADPGLAAGPGAAGTGPEAVPDIGDDLGPDAGREPRFVRPPTAAPEPTPEPTPRWAQETAEWTPSWREPEWDREREPWSRPWREETDRAGAGWSPEEVDDGDPVSGEIVFDDPPASRYPYDPSRLRPPEPSRPRPSEPPEDGRPPWWNPDDPYPPRSSR